MSERKSVVLYERDDGEASYFTSASIDLSGYLEIYNDDVGGSLVRMVTGGGTEYEFRYKILPQDAQTMLLSLLKERYADPEFELLDWLKSNEIQHEFSYWCSYK